MAHFRTSRQTGKIKQTGFTIVELLIVIVIIAVLASVTVVAFTGFTQRAKDSSDEANVSNILKKIAEYQAVEGEYRQDILIANGYPYGGVLNGSEIARLTEAGMSPEMMRNPDAPTGVMSSFVFDQYNTSAMRWLSEADDNETVKLTVVKDLPDGYSDWYELEDEAWAAYDEFYPDYVSSHPEPGGEATYEEYEAWSEAFQTAFFSEYPQYKDTFLYGEGLGEVSVPKTQLYFVQLLGDAPQPSDGCTFYGGDRFYCHHYDSTTDSYSDMAITGIRIMYYNRSSGEWKDKSLGSGEPFSRATASYK
jgi:prepilin-type N-terminal cleavage/methylation domain-containing protein